MMKRNHFKTLLGLAISVGLILDSSTALAQGRKKKLRQQPTPRADSSASTPLKQQLIQALNLSNSGQYLQAATQLFNLSRRPELDAEKAQIKHILGLMLMQLDLNQVAGFQFVDAIRLDNPKYTKQSIEKLSQVADMLGDDTLLNYAVSKVDVDDFPASSKDMIHFRIGEIKMKNRNFDEAYDSFSKVQAGSSYYNQAFFNKGLAQLEMNKVDGAIRTFQQLISMRSKAPVTDTNKVAAQLALARALYQKQDWDAAIDAYSQLPRDHFLWHSALFEQSWAMLRAARFRSALSNFQSLHSTYYEEFYIPESLLLRGIVYLYICKYDEMDKVLTLFEKSYGPVKSKINSFLGTYTDPLAIYAEIDKGQSLKRGDEIKGSIKLPYMVLKSLMDEGDVRRSLSYIKRVLEEKQLIELNATLRTSAFGGYAIKVINNRIQNTKIAIGEMVKAHLQNMRLELKDLFEQASFIRYEMINGKKETLKKKLAGKSIPAAIDEKIDRDFYVQNGYEYYPFQGEYWLDEIGNYHYLGQQSCE